MFPFHTTGHMHTYRKSKLFFLPLLILNCKKGQISSGRNQITETRNPGTLKTHQINTPND